MVRFTPYRSFSLGNNTHFRFFSANTNAALMRAFRTLPLDRQHLVSGSAGRCPQTQSLAGSAWALPASRDAIARRSRRTAATYQTGIADRKRTELSECRPPGRRLRWRGKNERRADSIAVRLNAARNLESNMAVMRCLSPGNRLHTGVLLPSCSPDLQLLMKEGQKLLNSRDSTFRFRFADR